ncbi:hypothetical protein OUZ56_020219 [Daphnia magna]|uniref:Uncharacterized protein n=1 Tax=Daphnia magna TaxID=35525 RepID=A0ABQ9ZDV5_9CRUS|nr:hypothetical protein OUZ56_020219 [Daphnia magna]
MRILQECHSACVFVDSTVVIVQQLRAVDRQQCLDCSIDKATLQGVPTENPCLQNQFTHFQHSDLENGFPVAILQLLHYSKLCIIHRNNGSFISTLLQQWMRLENFLGVRIFHGRHLILFSLKY